MRIKILLTVICLMSIAIAVALANGETIELGPASITMGLEELGAYDIVMGERTSTEHKDPDFVYEIIPLSIQIDGIDEMVQIEVHRMSTTEPLTVQSPESIRKAVWSIASKDHIWCLSERTSIQKRMRLTASRA